MIISMGWSKNDVTPLLTHWSYVFLHKAIDFSYGPVWGAHRTIAEIMVTTKSFVSWDPSEPQILNLETFYYGFHFENILSQKRC